MSEAMDLQKEKERKMLLNERKFANHVFVLQGRRKVVRMREARNF